MYYKFIWGNIDQICKKHFKENMFLYFRLVGVFFKNEDEEWRTREQDKKLFLQRCLGLNTRKTYTNTIDLLSENVKFYHLSGILLQLPTFHLNADFDTFFLTLNNCAH